MYTKVNKEHAFLISFQLLRLFFIITEFPKIKHYFPFLNFFTEASFFDCSNETNIYCPPLSLYVAHFFKLREVCEKH